MDHLPTPQAAAITSRAVLPAEPTGFVGGVWHPEDLVRAEGTPWIVVSAMRSTGRKGALLAIDLTAASPAVEIAWTPEAETGRRSMAAFDPHGIDIRPLGDGRFELLVVDHGDGEAIDRLTLDTTHDRPVIVAGERIAQPAGTSGNAVAFVPAGGFVMTSMFDPRDPAILEKFSAGRMTGGVWRWVERAGMAARRARSVGGNGIAVSPDGRTMIVSEWSARRVWKWSIGGDVLGDVDVDVLPDNLRWTADGSLLLAGQAARPERVFGCEARGEPCPLGFAVMRLDPVTMTMTTLIRTTHERATAIGFGGATGALQVGPEIWVGSFTGERLARYGWGA